MIVLPAFGETNVRTDTANRSAAVTVIKETSLSAFDDYLALFTASGYALKQTYRRQGHAYAALALGDEGVFLNYFAGVRQLSIVQEQGCRYFAFQDQPLPRRCAPQLTQLHLEDFGMSYAVRLSDGRFILFDGGREFEPEADRLYQHLKQTADRPVIAAWVLTHPHSDHFFAFLTFVSKYADDVVIQNVLFNFPEKDDFAHYPSLATDDPRVSRDCRPLTNIPLLEEAILRANANRITLHTGQTFRFADAACQVLACMDDTLHLNTRNINATSVVMRMEIAGQVILWLADASCSDAALAEKYGDFLKADIMQAPHHGFGSGTPEGEIACFRLIRPSVCLLPVSDYNAFTCFCTYKAGANYLMTRSEVDELITGEETRTLDLPYTASPTGREALRRAYLAGRDDGGSTAWVFTGLSTAREEDCRFTVLNMTHIPARLSIDVFFEDSARNLRYIQAQVPNGSMKIISIFDETSVNGDALHFNWMSLKALGVPQNAAFCVRFQSSIPVVVSNAAHRDTYHAVNR